jgi:hypothetical protein
VANAKGYKFTAIPNSTYTKSWKQKLHNKDMGLRAGFPDIVVIAHSVFIAIELKRSDGGAAPRRHRSRGLPICRRPASQQKFATDAMKR